MMKTGWFITALVALLLLSPLAQADFGGPLDARHAMSPDGKLLVRIETPKPEDQAQHTVAYYEFDSAQDAFVRRGSFPLTGYLAQMLYVSNAGDLVFIALGEVDSIRLYSKAGKLTKSWSLKDFLSAEEIEACAQTGSTLQWFDEAAFYNRKFSFRGPARRVRALTAPYTVMRGVDDKVKFAARIDVETATLAKD